MSKGRPAASFDSNGRMRDELLNETLFLSVAHARIEIAAWMEDYKPNWISNGLLRYALRVPLRSPLLQPRLCAKQPPGSNPSWGKAGGHVNSQVCEGKGRPVSTFVKESRVSEFENTVLFDERPLTQVLLCDDCLDANRFGTT